MSAENWKRIAEAEFLRLAQHGLGTGQIKNIARAAEGKLLYDTLTPAERDQVDALIPSLRGEFREGPSLIITRELHKLASKEERKKAE